MGVRHYVNANLESTETILFFFFLRNDPRLFRLSRRSITLAKRITFPRSRTLPCLATRFRVDGSEAAASTRIRFGDHENGPTLSFVLFSSANETNYQIPGQLVNNARPRSPILRNGDTEEGKFLRPCVGPDLLNRNNFIYDNRKTYAAR